MKRRQTINDMVVELDLDQNTLKLLANLLICRRVRVFEPDGDCCVVNVHKSVNREKQKRNKLSIRKYHIDHGC